MRNVSHVSTQMNKTAISLLRDAISAWRRSFNWSRETVTEEIVIAHERIGGNCTTGIVFDASRADRDETDRRKVNADRVFRWLDDESKDTNLLPTNFLPSILAALPAERRIEVVNAILAPCGLVARHKTGGW